MHIYSSGTGFQKNVNSSSPDKFVDVPPGLYRISWAGTPIKYEDVKVLEGYQTNLKY
jgi:hypothetical protein